ncbi:sporulation-specific diadenylate cyclase CdaS [Paenibacillus sediminis]|uniref:Diadenylate cyclase n=1 Tax=Paenibacillus sediminis TaxID=664909 RepID=A0ABS4H1V2_9BACL|nr:sporulation-specific diadenylate cyclase CdaS [Paenibacillus sediminis]MBP1936508.1 uncharacterized protein (TIGR00159 family) [Paenibacillus sediminis]
MKIEDIGLSSSMKTQLKVYLQRISSEIGNILDTIDEKECCILSEFEQVHKIFSDLQMTAASYYLNSYLSPYSDCYQDLSTAVQHFSERKHGAIIAVQRENSLRPYMHSGIPVGAKVTYSLLESIFYPGGPLHDGAVLIERNEIVSAGNVLPLSQSSTLSRKLGTRHRAALGLSEVSDALILVVSEETGKVSFAIDGNLYPIRPGGYE